MLMRGIPFIGLPLMNCLKKSIFLHSLQVIAPSVFGNLTRLMKKPY